LPEHDLALLTHAARAAGEIAMRYWRRTPKSWEKGDQGPVTEADIAVNDMLQLDLRGARPDYGWLSEETPDDLSRCNHEYTFIIDPIDGTRAFIAGEQHFSHSLAIARNGVVTAAVVYLPALDQLYTATHDGPALCDGEPIGCSQKCLADDANILTTKANLSHLHWRADPPVFRRSFRASLAYRLCLVADGSFDGMITFRDTWEWDIAAGGLIARRAGATVTDCQGGDLRFNSVTAQTRGVLACAPGLHSDLRQHINANRV
jgi:myo-inositol-1(or 4)-monophosphatase